jgi:mono/diheme cytochrome c family protein
VWHLIILTITAVLVSSACSSVGDTPVIESAAIGSDIYNLGQTVYNTQCAACHGANGEGQFPDAPLKPDITGRYGAPPHNDTGHTWHHDDDLLIQIIREGGMGDPVNFYVMPALQSVLANYEIEAVIAYIKTMWTPEQQAAQGERTLAVRPQKP